MSPIFLALLGSAYFLANALCMVAYLPQIWHVWRCAQARLQIVLATWWAWTLGGLTEWAYATWVAHQGVWIIMAAAHTLACGIVAILATRERWRAWRQRRMVLIGPPRLGVDRPIQVA